MQKLNRVTVDGETVLIKIVGELVDVAALSWACETAEVRVPQIERFGSLLDATGANTLADLGIPSEALRVQSSSCGRNEVPSRF